MRGLSVYVSQVIAQPIFLPVNSKLNECLQEIIQQKSNALIYANRSGRLGLIAGEDSKGFIPQTACG